MHSPARGFSPLGGRRGSGVKGGWRAVAQRPEALTPEERPGSRAAHLVVVTDRTSAREQSAEYPRGRHVALVRFDGNGYRWRADDATTLLRRAYRSVASGGTRQSSQV
jgi:hypothetical protein